MPPKKKLGRPPKQPRGKKKVTNASIHHPDDGKGSVVHGTTVARPKPTPNFVGASNVTPPSSLTPIEATTTTQSNSDVVAVENSNAELVASHALLAMMRGFSAPGSGYQCEEPDKQPQMEYGFVEEPPEENQSTEISKDCIGDEDEDKDEDESVDELLCM